MASQITLPVWPTALNCLSWSQDNLIAVAGGDHVAILSPRLKEPGPNMTHWDNTLFKANAYTAEEVPLVDPLSFGNVSIGEELSYRHVQALEWSPPGLGKFQRCVLAVLSSNHILSLWACDNRIDVSANWERRLVVNHALREHYAIQNIGGETAEERREFQQVAQRVRAFAWIPQSHKLPATVSSVSDTSENHSFLAVSTERGDIVLLRVVSPYSILRPGVEKWRVEIIHHFSADFSALNVSYDVNGEEYAKPPDEIKDKYVADHLASSAFDENKQATLACITRGCLVCVNIALREAQETSEPVLVQGTTKHFVPGRSDLAGPIKFVPKSRILIVFAADAVLCIDTDFDQQDERFTFHHLDGRWDEVSGASFSPSGSVLPLVHISSLLSGSTAPTAMLTVPLDNGEKSSRPSWQGAITESKRSFSRQYNLDDHVQARVWGIASSPLGDIVATATVLLPSDAPAYITPSEHRTVINIARERLRGDDDILPITGGVGHPSDVNSDTLLFSLQRALEQRRDGMHAEFLLNGLLKTANRPTESSEFEYDVSFPQNGGPLRYARYLRSILFTARLMKERLKVLVDMALEKITDDNQISKHVVQHLVPAVLKLPADYQQSGELSRNIYKVYSILNSKLQNAIIEDGDETCRICHDAIPFQSVKWAKCGSGHQFSRCGLTFLAIQEPNISKHCNICDAQFLNEWALPAFVGKPNDEDVEMADLRQDDMQTGCAGLVEAQTLGDNLEDAWVQVSHVQSTTEQPRSLARLLFAAFDICIYCGGKFTV